MSSKTLLAIALREAGLGIMAQKAEAGYYHDFESPLDTPSVQLAHDLATYAAAPSWPRREDAQRVLDRHLAGEFDATKEESEAWAQSPEGRETFEGFGAGFASKARERRSERLGDAPIERAYHDKMNAVAAGLDEVFNGETKAPNKKVGFVLLVFPYGSGDGRCNYISNGADRRDIVTLLKEQIARFEGQPEVSGKA